MTSRASRDEVLMEVAHAFSKRGTCSRLQVGAVFSRDGRIISTGYNGSPAGMPHCTHQEYTWPSEEEILYGDTWYHDLPEWAADLHRMVHQREGLIPRAGQTLYFDGRTISDKDSGCTQAEHAERNAIAWAARHGLALEGTEVHVTHMPCEACARTLINAGVTRVAYQMPYRLTVGVDSLEAAGITVVYMPPAGLI